MKMLWHNLLRGKIQKTSNWKNWLRSNELITTLLNEHRIEMIYALRSFSISVNHTFIFHLVKNNFFASIKAFHYIFMFIQLFLIAKESSQLETMRYKQPSSKMLWFFIPKIWKHSPDWRVYFFSLFLEKIELYIQNAGFFFFKHRNFWLTSAKS